MNYKNCASCEESLPETCFWNDGRRKDGKRPYCKACEADRHKNWRVKTGKTKNPRTPAVHYKMCDDQ